VIGERGVAGAGVGNAACATPAPSPGARPPRARRRAPAADHALRGPRPARRRARRRRGGRAARRAARRRDDPAPRTGPHLRQWYAMCCAGAFEEEDAGVSRRAGAGWRPSMRPPDAAPPPPPLPSRHRRHRRRSGLHHAGHAAVSGRVRAGGGRNARRCGGGEIGGPRGARDAGVCTLRDGDGMVGYVAPVRRMRWRTLGAAASAVARPVSVLAPAPRHAPPPAPEPSHTPPAGRDSVLDFEQRACGGRAGALLGGGELSLFLLGCFFFSTPPACVTARCPPNLRL